jgi:hypothetical protein
MLKLPVWNEDGGQQTVTLLPHVHQLDALGRIGQAFDCHGDAFNALELDLKSKRRLDLCQGLLGDSIALSNGNFSKLRPKGSRVGYTVQRWNGWGVATAACRVPLSLANSLKNEMLSSVPFGGHA